MTDAVLTPEQEIVQEVKRRCKDPQILEKIKFEIEFMKSKPDLDGKGTGLDKLHYIWKKRKGQKGKANEVQSWTAYALGLTEVSPTQWELFQKLRRVFARKGFPDIDSDFVSHGREKIIDHIVARYGRSRVGNIGTWGVLSLKAATKRAVKVFDLAGAYHKGSKAYTSENELLSREISKTLDPYKRGAMLVALDEDGQPILDKDGKEVKIKTTGDAYKYVPDFRKYLDRNPEVIKNLQNIEGLVNQFGVHASGVVISDLPLNEIAPLRPAKERTEDGQKVVSYATQMSNDDLEQLGLIKFDILGIATLDVIEEALRLIKETYDVDIDLENLPLDDRKTYELFQTGNLIGVFQCEGYGMQKTCKEIGVDRFEDIMAALSLYRPGPMGSIPEYAARKKGFSQVEYFHPTIEQYVKPFLERTYGILVYQEQVMQICNALAGFTISDGYGMIKAVGKKQTDLMTSYAEMFEKGCVMNGVPREVAKEYWDRFITPFSSYGFNGSHSCCYAYNAYITAYLKANFPDEYLCAYLSVAARAKKWSKVATLERDCKKNNIEIAKRTINTCDVDWKIIRRKNPKNGIETSEFRPSIMCKDLAGSAGEAIVRGRSEKPYVDLADFATRVWENVDGQAVLALCESGFFPKKKADSILKEFDMIREDMKRNKKRGEPSGDMFD